MGAGVGIGGEPVCALAWEIKVWAAPALLQGQICETLEFNSALCWDVDLTIPVCQNSGSRHYLRKR